MEPGLRRRLLTHLVVMTAVSAAVAFTAILALSMAGEAVGTAVNLLERAEGVQRVGGHLERVAYAGERIVLTGEGKDRLAGAMAELKLARARMRKESADLSSLDRRVDDYAVAISAAAAVRGGDLREAFEAYRNAMRPVREVFQRDAGTLLAKLRSESASARERAARLTNRARLGVALTVLLGIAMTLALSVKLFRDLRQQASRSKVSADAARRAIVSRQELLAASSELRGPVETILQRSSSFRNGGSDAALDEITAAGERLQAVLERLLDVTAVEEKTVELSRERCDTSSLIGLAATSVQLVAAERAVHVRIEAPIPVLVYVDRRRILQVLATLLGSAVRSARVGGEVTVTARPLDGEVRFSIYETGGESLPEGVPRVFERASAVTAESGGMGLHVSRRMIEAHGGRFGGEPMAQGGIWFHLPTEPQLLKEPKTSRSAHA